MSKTGYPEPLAKRALARKRDSEAIEGVTGAASGGVQKAFLAASVADRLPTRFRRPPGSILGAILASKNAFFGHLCWSLGSSFWN